MVQIFLENLWIIVLVKFWLDVIKKKISFKFGTLLPAKSYNKLIGVGISMMLSTFIVRPLVEEILNYLQRVQLDQTAQCDSIDK